MAVEVDGSTISDFDFVAVGYRLVSRNGEAEDVEGVAHSLNSGEDYAGAAAACGGGVAMVRHCSMKCCEIQQTEKKRNK